MTNATTARRHWKIVSLCVVVALASLIFWQNRDTQESTSLTPSNKASTSPDESQTPSNPKSFDKSARSLTKPSSIWVIVNKRHALNPKTYVPSLKVPTVPLKAGSGASNMHVSAVMAPALESLFAGAKSAGYTLMLSSGYRSYSYQISVYNNIVRSQGRAAADRQSARPGFSEHQTGLAADVAPRSGRCDLSQCFGSTPEGKWLAANAWRYGFIIRYPADKETVTGYEYEPWHIRYVGVDLSTEMHAQSIETLEEFFGVSGGTRYN